MLKWTRGKVTGNNGRGTHTTYTATLRNGDEVMVKSVEGSFFMHLNGKQVGWFDSLKDAKAGAQRVNDRLSA